MANEAVCIESPTRYARYTVTDSGTIPKGTILKLSDPNTAAASSSTDVYAGIAVMEKLTLDGSTEITAALDGVYDLTSVATVGGEGAITAGCPVALSGANIVRKAQAADLLTGAAFGRALETATGSEVVRVRIGAVGV